MDFLALIRERREQLDGLAGRRDKSRSATGRIRIASRLSEVLDVKGRKPLFTDIACNDPLDFPGYAEKVASLQKRSSRPDAFICMEGAIDGRGVVAVELLPQFMMGSMGTALGEAVARAAELALEKRLPLLVFSASGGARMQEGMFSLMQMAKTSAAIRRLGDAGLLYVSVLTHPTTGGVTASFASLGDVIIAEPGALIGFAGPRVIEQTMGTALPEGFQSAEFQLAHGFVDTIAERRQMRKTVSAILALHEQPSAGLRNAPPVAGGVAQKPPANDAGQPTPPANDGEQRTPYEQVQLARHPLRPHFDTFCSVLFTGFIEMHGDRLFGDDRALSGGIARFGALAVSVAGHVKGHDLNSNVAANFGMPHPEGYRKFMRLARQAEKFSRPLLTFIDTPGAFPGAGAEERGQGEAIAQCLALLSGLRVPIVAAVTGEGGSGGALALGVADHVIMLENAVYSVLSPEGFASILWKDAKLVKEASAVMKLTASDLLGFGMVDELVREPTGGAHNDPEAAAEALREPLDNALARLLALDADELLARRYSRLRRFA